MLAQVRDDLIRQMFESDMELLRRKGYDYAGEQDALTNLREYGVHGVIVRLNDKINRLKSIDRNGWIEVKTESVSDTLLDISNYAYLARVLLWEQKQKEEDEVHEE